MGRTQRRGALAAGMALAGLVGLAGPQLAGASAPTTPAGVLRQSVTALGKASTLTLRGYVVEGATRVGLNVRAAGKGAESAGLLTLGGAKAGSPVQTIQFVRLGSRLEMRANKVFWVTQAGKQLPSAVVNVLANRWVTVPSSDLQGLANDIASFTDPAKLAASFLGGPATGLRFGPVTTVDGVKVRPVEDTGDSARIEVPVAGPPRPVEIVGRSGNAGGDLHFTYPAHLTFTAPKAVSLQALIVKALKG